MTLTISRLSGMTDHSTFSLDGDRLEMGGNIFGASLAQAQSWRNSLASLSLGSVEPIDSTPDTAITGMWRIDKLNVDAAPGMWDRNYGFGYRLSATRVGSWQIPIITGRSIGRERTGAGGVSEDYWMGLPSAIHGRDLAGDSAAYYTRTGPGGSVLIDVDASLANNVVSYTVAPSDYYDMAPTITVDGSVVLGRQPLAIGNTDDWQLDNGFVRVKGASSSSHTLRFAGPIPASPGTYGTDYSLIVGGYLSGTRKILRPSAVQVMHNDAELCVLRLIGYIQTTGTTDNYALTLDIGLRRGGSFVECVQAAKLAIQHSIKNVGAAALTVVTANKTVRSTANDGNGNRLWLASGTSLNTGSVASGEVYSTASATQLPFALGIELDGSSSVAPNTVAEQFDHYWADQSITFEVGS